MNGKEILKTLEGQTILIQLGDEAGQTEDLELPQSLMLILDNIRREWAGSEKLDQLLNYVYQTASMLAVKDTHKPEEKVKLNLQMEREKLNEELGL